MRNKIDYGIDLGTTNSVIARMENGVPTIKKSDTLKDTFPSCIHFNKKKGVLVGDQAFNVLKNDSARALKTFETGKTNTFLEFKRTMGTTHAYYSSNMGRSFTSDELSAEVLKKLKSVVTDENISSIVITVPAKFLNPQCEATMNAARLLGFKQVHLLQEPVAAATAYGLSAKEQDGFWLVFDFGGGTFDVALIKSEEGILSVKDTEGDNWLGGKNLDEAIIDQTIIPYLQSNYAIDSVLEDNDKKQILRTAVKFYAEETKNQMSFKDKYHILSNLGDLPFEDENDEELEIDIEITQADMERVCCPIFQKAIDITKDLLKRNHLEGSDISSLILVGGPTYSPILQRMLKEQITQKIDTSVDPMTVVAKGAALFASTISISDEIKDQTRDTTKLQLDVKYEATSVEPDEMVNIKILRDKSIDTFSGKMFAELVRADSAGIAWSSGKKQITEKSSLMEVPLSAGQSNSFEIHVFDEQGNRLECQPNQFSILQGIGGLDSMQTLPYHICIVKYFNSEEKDLIEPVRGLEKNKKLPATGVKNGLKTRSAIRPGMTQDIIRIPVYQGAYATEGTNPIHNNFVTEVIITGETLPALLPEGSDVDITIKVDRSGLMKFNAYFPLLEHTEELEVEIKQMEPPKIDEIAKEISNAKKVAEKVNDNKAFNNLSDLEQQLQNEAGSADGKMRILDSLRKELLKLEEKEKEIEWPKVQQELKDAFYEFEYLIEKIKTNGGSDELNMDKIEEHIQEYKKTIEQVIKNKDIKEAKHLISEIESLDFNLKNAVTGNAMDVQFMRHIDSEFESFHWKDRNKARQLCNQGLQLATAGKTTAIRPLLVQLIALMPDDEKPKETLV